MTLPSLPVEVRRILDLARRDRAAAREALGALPLDAQVELVCLTPAGRRAELLALASNPEELVPRLPEAELCFALTGVGLADAAWLLEHATREQIIACVDLDAWRGDAPDREALGAWLAVLAEAGDETLVRAAQSLDPELLVLALRDRLEVFQKPSGDDDWEPPDGGHTVEGQFFFRARREGDDVAELAAMLRALFEQDYWLYFRLMQGSRWELESDAEAWAERWRAGRLEDLGFPAGEESRLRLYSRIPTDRLAVLPEDTRGLDVEAWRLPVWRPELPVARDARHSLFRAAAQLGDDERAAFFFGFLGLANRVAVADGRPLGDAASAPAAMERAAEVASAGLDLLARENGIAPSEVLRRVPLDHLFRVGTNLRGEGPARASDTSSDSDAEPPSSP